MYIQYILDLRVEKSVATSAGVVLGVNPILLLILAIIFFGVLYIFKYVSLSSIIANLLRYWLSHHTRLHIIWDELTVSIILIVRHRTNIVRILKAKSQK